MPAFPVFLLYPHGRTWLRIDSPVLMHELRVLGPYYCLRTLEARTLPDRVLIADLLAADAKALTLVTEPEYEAFLETCRQTKTEKDF